MSTAGEAASLFGAPDSSGDLFGEAVSSNAEPSTHAEDTDPFSGQQTLTNDFFDTVNSAGDTYGSNQDVANGETASYSQSWMGANQQASYGQQANHYPTGYSQQSYANGWSGQQTHWSSYEQHETTGSCYFPAYIPS